MNFFKTLERVQLLHDLIKSEATGSPEQLSRRLGVCRKTLYNIIDELKSYEAPIKYSKQRETFYYSAEFELDLHYNFSVISNESVLKNTNGGLFFHSTGRIRISYVPCE